MKKLVSLKERLVAIGEFAGEAVAVIDEIIKEGNAKAVASADKPVAKGKTTPAKEVETPTEDPLAEVITEYELGSKSVAELKELLAETDVKYNKNGKKASDFIPLVAQAILDGKLGGDDEDSDEDAEEISEEDIQAMKLPELIEFAKDNEIEIPKASAKSVAKVREIVLEWLLENSEEVDEDEVEEEVDEDAMSEEEVTALTASLMEKDLADLKELLTEAEIDFSAKAKKPALVALVVAGVIDGSIELSEDEDSDEDDSDEEEEGYTEDDINAMSLKELVELAKEAEVEYTAKDAKSVDKMKAILIEAICEEDEESEEDDSEDEELTQEDVEAMDLAELLELAKDSDIEIPKAIAKKVDKVRALIIEACFEEDEEDDSEVSDDDEDDEEEEVPAVVRKAEDKVRKDVTAKVKGGKLNGKKLKEFLKQYYEGDADCADCKGCSEAEVLECYTNIQVALVDDDGDIMEMGSPYVRRGIDHCCGRELETLDNGNQVCAICGNEFEPE